MLLNIQIESEARANIIEGLQKTTCLRDLQAALSDEADAVELDFQRLIDIEVRAVAGLFFGLCRRSTLRVSQKLFNFASGFWKTLTPSLSAAAR